MFKQAMSVCVLLLAGCSDDPHITPDPSGTGASSQGGNGTGGSGAAGGAGGASSQGGSFVSGSRLKVQTLVGDDGSRSPSGWLDSQFSTECSYARATDGVTRCLPVGPTTTYFLDSACTLPLVVTTCGKPSYVRVATDSCGSTSVHPVGGEVDASATVYRFLTPTTCGETGLPEPGTRYGAGAAMDAAGFVRATTETEQ